jgi:hypothetical protein
VNEWKDKTLIREKKNVELSTKEYSSNFFKTCVRPCTTNVNDLEEKLVSRFGINNSSKPTSINDVPIWSKETWETFMDSFLDGNVFLEISDLEFVSESGEL